jgi:hypothetical protein
LGAFSRFVAAVRKGEMIGGLREIPEMTQFLQLFDNAIEPSLITHYTVEETPFGIKVADIFDCCEDSNYSINVTHSSGKGPFCVSAVYQHLYWKTPQVPHLLSHDMTSEVKLRKIYMYLIDTVRWINASKFFKEERYLEGACECGQHGFKDREYLNMLSNGTELQHTRENVSGCSRVCYDEFTRRVKVAPTHTWVEMTLDVQLESRTSEQLPLDYECLAQESEGGVPLKTNLTGKSHTAATSGTSDSDRDSMPGKTEKVRENTSDFTLSKPKIIRDEFGWPLVTDEAGKTYDFKLQLTFQSPPSSEFGAVTLQRVICAQQIGSATFITTSGSLAL